MIVYKNFKVIFQYKNKFSKIKLQFKLFKEFLVEKYFKNIVTKKIQKKIYIKKTFTFISLIFKWKYLKYLAWKMTDYNNLTKSITIIL